MAFIYDLANEGGGTLLQDSDGAAPALKVNSNAAGYPAIACQSTASGSVIQVTALSGAGLDVDAVAGIGVDADTTSTTLPAGDFRSAATIGPALIVGRTVAGLTTIAAMKFLHPSCASAAIMEFGGGMISCTSVIYTSAAKTDYVIPVSLQDGTIRYIPLVQPSAIVGGAAF